jgi:energy-coupling factor transporter ATP-binding protein EcfA2
MNGGDIELLELAVKKYKNLRDLRIPWSQRTVLYGQNGVGKTNLLETLALCFGSTATSWQLAKRAEVPEPGAISAVIAGGCDELPLPPAVCLRGSDGSEKTKRAPLVQSSAVFWDGFGATEGSGSTWLEAIEGCVAHPKLQALLKDMWERPLVRCTLETVEGLSEAARVDRSEWHDSYWLDDAPPVAFRRHFSRVLVFEGQPPGWLIDLAPSLGDAFSPFRRWLDDSGASTGNFVDLVELAPRDWAPVRVVWLASQRTSQEVWMDLEWECSRAREPMRALAGAIDRIRVELGASPEPDEEEAAVGDDELGWWITRTIQNTVDEVLGEIFPSLRVVSYGSVESPSKMTLEREEEHELGRLSEPRTLDCLSSGERAWTDLALARAIARLESRALVALVLARAIWLSPDELILDAAIKARLSDALTDGYWIPDELEAVFSQLIAAGLPIESVLIPGIERPHEIGILPLLLEIETDREALRPPLIVTGFDEPERHLHPSAQREAAKFLNRPSIEASVIATHSHYFLGASGARHVHLSKSPEGVVAASFEPSELTQSSAVAADMGLTSGELLSRLRYALFVEGPVDDLVLTAFYGEVLRDAGVFVMPIHGIDEALALSELRIIGELVDMGAGVLADHARSRMLMGKSSKRATKEERALRDLKAKLKNRGRAMDFFGLEREDILAYLPDEAVRAFAPDFPGWRVVESRRKPGEKLKEAAARLADRPFGRDAVRQVCQIARQNGMPLTGDLPGIVAQIVARADGRGLG